MIVIPENLIERPLYSHKIEPFIRKALIKVITGQRRAGKSYMMYQIIRRILSEDKSASVIYINTENYDFNFIKEAADLIDYVKEKSIKKKMNYIFIDEIQGIKEFEKAVRSLLLDKSNDIYITGSNARLLSGELSTLLAGRTVEISVHCLTYREFLLFHQMKDSDDSLEKYVLYGGLPFLVNLQLTEEVVFEYLKNIYNTIIFRDIISRHNLRNSYFLEQLVRFIADNTGSLFSSKSISDFLKSQKIMIPHNQVQAYTGYLSDTFIISRVSRYDIAGKRLFETGEKYYFEDNGIRNAIIGYKPGDRGKIIENVVHNELMVRGYDVTTGWKKDREIDFIGTRNNEKEYFQVTLQLNNQKTIDREFGNLLQINDNYPKTVISTDNKYKNTIQGVEHKNLRSFLMEGLVSNR